MSKNEISRTYLETNYVAERLVDAQVYVQAHSKGNAAERGTNPDRTDLITAVRVARLEFRTMQDEGQAWWRKTTTHSLSEPESPQDRIRETLAFAAERFVQLNVPEGKVTAVTRSLHAEIARVFPAVKAVEETSAAEEAEPIEIMVTPAPVPTAARA